MDRITVPEQFNPWKVSEWLEEWSSVANSHSLQVNFLHNKFCGPGGIAMLASCLSDRKAQGRRTVMLIDSSSSVCRYLQRIDFFNRLGVEIEEDFSRHDAGGRFVPLQSLTTESESRELANNIIDFVHAQVEELPNSLLNYSRFILDELGANIVQHAEAHETGFGLGQAYCKIQRLEYAYSDYGIGIFNSLSKNLEFVSRIHDDEDAIKLALQDKISRSADMKRNMGAGLFEFNRICERMNGEMWILSGNACIHREYSEGYRVVDETIRVPNYHGTWICFRASLQQFC